MLFNNLDKLITYLTKNCIQKEVEKENSSSGPKSTSSESEGELSSDLGDLEDLVISGSEHVVDKMRSHRLL